MYKIDCFTSLVGLMDIRTDQGRGTMRAITSVAFFLVLSIVAVFAQEGQKHGISRLVTVDIINAKGQSVGTAILSESPHGVRIKLDIKNLPPGKHLMHIHQFAKCEPPASSLREPISIRRARAVPSTVPQAYLRETSRILC